MRRSVGGHALLAALFLAVGPATAEEASHPYQELKIALPAGAKLVMEMDAHDDDLLGVVKSLLRGFNAQTLAAITQEGPRGPGPVGSGPGQPAIAAPVPGQAPGGQPSAPAVANLADILRETHQVHLVAFVPAEGTKPDDLLPFFEEPFRAEGGRRLLWLPMEGAQILIDGFREPRGFALVMLPGQGQLAIVLRADGYPNLEPVGPFVAAFASLFRGMSSMRSPGTAPSPKLMPPSSPAPPGRRAAPPASRPPLQRGTHVSPGLNASRH